MMHTAADAGGVLFGRGLARSRATVGGVFVSVVDRNLG